MVWLRNASISASSHYPLADDEMDWLAVVEITVVTWKHFVTSGPWLDHVSFAAPLMTCHLSVVYGQIVVRLLELCHCWAADQMTGYCRASAL